MQVANPSVASLYEDALVYEDGSAITSSGALSAYSGTKTGRSPSDKRIVQEPSSEKNVWWGPVNRPMTTDVSFFSFNCLFLSRHTRSLSFSFVFQLISCYEKIKHQTPSIGTIPKGQNWSWGLYVRCREKKAGENE
jgi:ATP-dependent phosphoenolpyruvate carboxykinase